MNKYCENPWTQKVVKLFDDKIKFCCKVSALPLNEHTARLDEVKEAFLNDQLHPACNACWNDEKQGGKSFRLLSTTPVNKEDIIKLHTKEDNLKILDIEFGFVCNMFCMSCGPGYSTTWQQKLKINPWESKSLDEKILNDLAVTLEKNKDTLRRINVFGGEASVDPAFYKFVEILKESAPVNCTIRIITNGNYSEKFKERFENAITSIIESGRKVDLTFSLDAAGAEGEFIRGGLDNAKFIKNIKDMIAFGITPQVQISISILNLENYIEIFKWLEHEGILDKVRFHLNKISHPWEFSFNALGKHTVDFLPKWPDGLTGTWKQLHNQHINFIGNQQNNTEPPNKASLSKIIKQLDIYANVSQTKLPDYYISLKDRLTKIIND